jgi:DNA repair protein RAD57
MTDLLTILPSFPTAPYTHLLPSLEKNLITTSDLLTLDAIEIAKRAQLPILDVKRLAKHVLDALHNDLELEGGDDGDDSRDEPGEQEKDEARDRRLKKTGTDIEGRWSTISLLDDTLDNALGGGIPTGYITEVTGERYLTV